MRVVLSKLDTRGNQEDNQDMTAVNAKQIESALEEISRMPLPENETVFAIDLHEREGHWQVGAVISPFASASPDYPSKCVLPTFDFDFLTREEALKYAQDVGNILVDRGKDPDGPTASLLESSQ